MTKHALAYSVDEYHLFRSLTDADLEHALEMCDLQFQHYAWTQPGLRINEGMQVQVHFFNLATR